MLGDHEELLIDNFEGPFALDVGAVHVHIGGQVRQVQLLALNDSWQHEVHEFVDGVGGDLEGQGGHVIGYGRLRIPPVHRNLIGLPAEPERLGLRCRRREIPARGVRIGGFERGDQRLVGLLEPVRRVFGINGWVGRRRGSRLDNVGGPTLDIDEMGTEFTEVPVRCAGDPSIERSGPQNLDKATGLCTNDAEVVNHPLTLSRPLISSAVQFCVVWADLGGVSGSGVVSPFGEVRLLTAERAGLFSRTAESLAGLFGEELGRWLGDVSVVAGRVEQVSLADLVSGVVHEGLSVDPVGDVGVDPAVAGDATAGDGSKRRLRRFGSLKQHFVSGNENGSTRGNALIGPPVNCSSKNSSSPSYVSDIQSW